MTKKRSGRKYPSAPLSPFPHISACGSGCGSKLSHTLTHRSKRAKNKEKVLFSLENRTFCDCHGFAVRAPSAYRKERGVRGGNLCGFPRSCSVTRPQATTFAQQKCSSKRRKPPNRVVFVLELLGGFEPPTSSLPKSRGCFCVVPIHTEEEPPPPVLQGI